MIIGGVRKLGVGCWWQSRSLTSRVVRYLGERETRSDNNGGNPGGRDRYGEVLGGGVRSDASQEIAVHVKAPRRKRSMLGVGKEGFNKTLPDGEEG